MEEAKMSLKKKSGVGMLVVLSTVLAGSGVAKAGDQVPFKGSETGVQIFLDFVFPLLTVGFTSSGNGTQVGNYTTEGSVVINVVTGEAFDAHATLTAANGDQVFVDLDSLPLTPTTSLITGTITGGTGRFEGATGGYEYFLETEFPSDVLPNPFTGTWSGTISSPGSNGRTEASAEPDALIRQRVD